MPFEEAARNTGHSVPAAAGRSVMAQPKRRSYALLLSAGVLAGLTGISLLRMQDPKEQEGAGVPRRARLNAPAARSASKAPATLETIQAPLASAEASGTSTPVPAMGPPPLAQAAESEPGAAPSAPGGGAPAATENAAPPGVIDDPDSLTTMEPLTVVELAPGKSVEIEARTRLSLRLRQEARERRAAGPRRSENPRGAGRTGARSERDPEREASASPVAGRKSRAPERAPSKAGSGNAEGDTARETPAPRASSELMNPWPSPVVGPAKE
jgi:hypothetical protein